MVMSLESRQVDNVFGMMTPPEMPLLRSSRRGHLLGQRTPPEGLSGVKTLVMD